MIASDFKRDIAQYYRQRLTKIIINESVEITEYEIEVIGQAAEVTFVIPSEITEINRLDFKSEEAVISICLLYVPVNTDSRFKYRLEVI